MSVTITLPGEPRGKGRPRFDTRSGRAYTPEETRSYEGALKLAGEEAMDGREPLDGTLAVHVIAGMAMPKGFSQRKRDLALSGTLRPGKRPDIDNIVKCLDALNQVVWRDDAQIVTAVVEKVYAARPALRIEVTRYPAELEAAE